MTGKVTTGWMDRVLHCFQPLVKLYICRIPTEEYHPDSEAWWWHSLGPLNYSSESCEIKPKYPFWQTNFMVPIPLLPNDSPWL